MKSTRLLIGFHAVTARLRQHADSIAEILLDRQRADPRAHSLQALAAERGVKVHSAAVARLDELAGGKSHQGVIALVQGNLPYVTVEDVLDAASEPPLLLILDGVHDPHNLGACLRCADVFGAHAIVVPKDRAVGVNATVAKVASGAAETVPVVAVTNLARTLRGLKDRGVWIFGADADGDESLYNVKLEGPVAWVLGAEGAGLRRLTRELCDRIVSIPQHGSVTSLNVSVAAGICLFATRQQRALGSKPVGGL